tara:strand:- start:823 stop:1383 length:561 start_codon:yes stop_codon:yes gene_type:complete
MELINFISIYDDIIHEKPLSKLIRVCKDFKWEDALVGKGNLDKDIRKVKMCVLSNCSDSITNVHWHNVMQNRFEAHLKKYVEVNDIKLMYSAQLETIQVLKYDKSDHYTWHYDSFPGINRTFSCVYFLNEDYEGGELCFRNPDGTGEFTIPKKKNRMIIWPSSFLYPHTVRPVKEGEKYSIVSWTQ